MTRMVILRLAEAGASLLHAVVFLAAAEDGEEVNFAVRSDGSVKAAATEDAVDGNLQGR